MNDDDVGAPVVGQNVSFDVIAQRGLDLQPAPLFVLPAPPSHPLHLAPFRLSQILPPSSSYDCDDNDDVLCHAPWTAFPCSCRDDDDVHHGCCVHDAMAPELINIEQRELGASAWAFFLRWDSAQDARERETESPTGMNWETVGRGLVAPL